MKIKILTIVKAVLGIVWVAAFAACGVMMFMSIDSWTQKLLKDNDVKILSKFTGGETNFEKSGDGYILVVHKPVSDGVFSKSKESFIQLDWLSKNTLPDKISEEIDLDRDGTVDLNVSIDTKEERVIYQKYNNNIFGLVSKSSLADFGFKKSKDGRDALFTYHDRKYNDTVYSNGISIRLLIKGNTK